MPASHQRVWSSHAISADDSGENRVPLSDRRAFRACRGRVSHTCRSHKYSSLPAKTLLRLGKIRGAWEAIYIIEGLLNNTADVQPDKIHADTQGQSLPVYALAHLCGFELLPRVRNWKDMDFFRPSKTVVYSHIDALFGDPGRNVINWKLIETHWSDLMRVVWSNSTSS
jgi:TnpA family transposase